MKIKILFLLFSMLLIWACSDNGTKPDEPVLPEIVTVRVDSIWNINSSQTLIVEVKVEDPQGYNTINNVLFMVSGSSGQQIFSDSLFDDGGLKGISDVIAGDGVFRNVFLPSAISNLEGQYTFNFSVSDKDGNDAEPSEKNVSFEFNYAPKVISVQAPDLLPSGSAPIDIMTTITFLDDQRAGAEVQIDLTQNNASVLSQKINMQGTAVDSVFMLSIDSSFAAGRKGSYQMEFTAKNSSGAESEVFNKSIFLENEAGVLNNLALADTLIRPNQSDVFTATLITIDVHDQQGPGDINEVYFEVYYPDGTGYNNNPFYMVDNGLPFNFDNLFEEAGDQTANDGTFSLTFLVNDANPAGTYQFKFYMKDKAGNLSNVIQDTVEVL